MNPFDMFGNFGFGGDPFGFDDFFTDPFGQRRRSNRQQVCYPFLY